MLMKWDSEYTYTIWNPLYICLQACIKCTTLEM